MQMKDLPSIAVELSGRKGPSGRLHSPDVGGVRVEFLSPLSATPLFMPNALKLHCARFHEMKNYDLPKICRGRRPFVALTISLSLSQNSVVE